MLFPPSFLPCLLLSCIIILVPLLFAVFLFLRVPLSVLWTWTWTSVRLVIRYRILFSASSIQPYSTPSHPITFHPRALTRHVSFPSLIFSYAPRLLATNINLPRSSFLACSNSPITQLSIASPVFLLPQGVLVLFVSSTPWLCMQRLWREL